MVLLDGVWTRWIAIGFILILLLLLLIIIIVMGSSSTIITITIAVVDIVVVAITSRFRSFYERLSIRLLFLTTS